MNKVTIKEYANKENISIQAVYKRVDKGVVKKFKEGNRTFIMVDDDFINQDKESQTTENIDIYKKEIEYLKKTVDRLEKENEDLKYQLKDKEYKINQLLEKQENLNDRVIGLIEYSHKSWIDKLINGFKK